MKNIAMKDCGPSWQLPGSLHSQTSLGTGLGKVAVEIIEGFNKHVSRIFFKYL